MSDRSPDPRSRHRFSVEHTPAHTVPSSPRHRKSAMPLRTSTSAQGKSPRSSLERPSTEVAASSLEAPNTIVTRRSSSRNTSRGPSRRSSDGAAHLSSVSANTAASTSTMNPSVSIAAGPSTEAVRGNDSRDFLLNEVTEAPAEEKRMSMAVNTHNTGELSLTASSAVSPTNKKEIEAAAAQAHAQLSTPAYADMTERAAAGERAYEATHDYVHLVAGLHQRLGVLPRRPSPIMHHNGKSYTATAAATPSNASEVLGKEKGSKARHRLTSPASVVEEVTDKVLALRRAEMAEMVARLRRLMTEGGLHPLLPHDKSNRDDATAIPILPAAGSLMQGHASTDIDGAAPLPPCPPCDFCVELASAETIERCLVPVLQTLVAARVMMPVRGRQGSLSVPSSAVANRAMTLDSLLVHSSASHDRHHHHNSKAGEESSGTAEALPSTHRYTTPRCFRMEVVPFGLRRVSIHVTVQPYVAENFYHAHARQQSHLFSLAVDPPYPADWSAWTSWHKMRLLHRVLGDLLHGGPAPPVPETEVDLVLFPAHEDKTRDKLWLSVWNFSSARTLFSTSEDDIVDYFGPEVMFYYAWMNHYARWLLGAGGLGVLVSLLSSLRIAEITGYQPHLALVPINLTGLSDAVPPPPSSIWRQHLQYSLDLALLPSFILTMIVGSVLCIKGWERRCSTLTMKYHLFQQQEKDELQRDFCGRPGVNPVTGAPELVYPAWYRAVVLQPLAWALVLLFMCGTLIVMVCSLNLDGMVSSPDSLLAIPMLRRYTESGHLLDPALHPVLAMLPSFAYSVTISLLSTVFVALAAALTKMENYRRRGEYIRALTLKRVAFEFVNSYAKLFFVAFGRGSMEELASNLQSILYVSVLSRFLSDTLVPFVITHRQRVARRLLRPRADTSRSSGRSGKDHDGAVAPLPSSKQAVAAVLAPDNTNDLAALEEVDEMLDPYDVYGDMNEMIIQFGHILLFAAAYPIASFVALLSNLIEVRSDLFKMCYVVRRPVPRLGLQQNGTWCGILRIFAMASVITNTFLLAFTSHQMALWFPRHFTSTSTSMGVSSGGGGVSKEEAQLRPDSGQWVMLYAILMEHAMGIVAAFLLWRIPSTPRKVRHYLERRLYERMTPASQTA